MAKEFALKGVITFLDNKASQTIKTVDTHVMRLKKNTQRIGAGFQQVSAGLTVMGAAGAGIGVGFGKAIQSAMQFEKQMSVVTSLTTGTKEEFAAMEAQAKRLGATTIFSAKEAAQGLEFLALAGFKAKDTTSVLPVVLNTAAAGSLDLGRASDIVTDSMSALTQAFDPMMSKTARATKLADIMALAQARSNTNIEQLGEAIKFGGGALSALGIPLEQIIASMGKLADASLKGSLGGTALTNMFNKLLKPTGPVKNAMKLLGVNMEKLPLQDMPKLMSTLTGALNKLKDPNQKAAIAIELFGQRGMRAFHALNAAGADAIAGLTKELDKAQGSSARIAKERTNNFYGQMVAIKSATQAILIEIGNFFIKNEALFMPFIRRVVKGFQAFFEALQLVNGDQKTLDKRLKKATPQFKKLVEFAIGFKEGLMEAFKTAKSFFKGVFSFIRKFLPQGEGSAQVIGKMVGKFSLLLALLSPLLLGFVAIAFAGGKIIAMFGGAISMVRGFIGIGIQLAGILKTVAMGLFSLALKALPLVKMAIMAVAKAGIFLVTTPLGWIILAVVGLIAIGWLLYKNWDKVVGFLTDMWTGFAAVFKGTIGALVTWLKEASLGEIVLKTILFPIRAALTPIMELIRWISKSSLVKKLIGKKNAQLVESFAANVSLVPREEIQAKLAEEEKKIMPARDVNQAAAERTKLTAPVSSSQPDVNVSVQQPPIEANITVESVLDGEKISKNQTKRIISNTDRAGENLSAKGRQKMKYGQFAKGVM
jgi:TP901 family phage tail tape measure protein